MMGRRYGTWIAVGLAVVAIVVSLVAGLTVAPEPLDSGPEVTGILILVTGLAIVAWTLLTGSIDGGSSPPPWTTAGALASGRPESSTIDSAISGTTLTEQLESAAAAGREESISAGIAAVRPVLREALLDALVQGGFEQQEAESALEAGAWTDDPVAAAVLDESVAPPKRSIRRRLWAWLFPEKAIRFRVARAVSAIERASEDAVPTVVGQRAPRPVPIADPTLDDLQRAADGSLQQAVDGGGPPLRRYDEQTEEESAEDEPDPARADLDTSTLPTTTIAGSDSDAWGDVGTEDRTDE